MTDREQAAVLGVKVETLRLCKYGHMNFGDANARRVAEITGSSYEIWRRNDKLAERQDALKRHKLINTIRELQEELEQIEVPA